MDGVRVLKKGGPSFLGWRKKRDGIELWATNDGMEVREAGTHLWGINALRRKK